MKLKRATMRLPILIATLAVVAYVFFRFDLSSFFLTEAAAQQAKSQASDQTEKQVTQKKLGEQNANDIQGIDSESASESKSAIGNVGGGKATDESKDLSSRAPSDKVQSSIKSPNGIALVKSSHALLGTQSFKANIQQRAFIFGKEVISTGTYLQADGGRGGVRIDLGIRTEHLDLEVRMFNDGTYFFRETIDKTALLKEDSTSPQLQPTHKIESVNLRRMSDQLSKDPHWPGRWIAFGGLYLFMQQMQKCFNFSTPVERMIGETNVLVTRGTWKPEKLVLVLPEQKDSILNSATINLNKIPPQIPTEIELYCHADGVLKDLPRRIVFYRPDSELTNGGKQIPILVTDYVDAEFIDTPEARRFRFSANEFKVHDITDEFLSEVRK